VQHRSSLSFILVFLFSCTLLHRKIFLSSIYLIPRGERERDRELNDLSQSRNLRKGIINIEAIGAKKITLAIGLPALSLGDLGGRLRFLREEGPNNKIYISVDKKLKKIKKKEKEKRTM